ncbi:MAG: hypothetical protein JW925_12575 [Syntrophaceae bacterium]|nr:hypothetical protein [Syntrophaceae bacterium]
MLVKKKKRYEQLKKMIGDVEYILKGTITDRYYDLGGKTCGPYYQWTFKEGGKTKTVNLSKEQNEEYGKAIRNYKKIKEILKEMEEISLQILDMTTIGVKKRK